MAEALLTGVTPEPLGAYLKGLGVFRAVATQLDSGARACWRGDALALDVAGGAEAVLDFYLSERRDIYSLAATFGEMVTGKKPHLKALLEAT